MKEVLETLVSVQRRCFPEDFEDSPLFSKSPPPSVPATGEELASTPTETVKSEENHVTTPTETPTSSIKTNGFGSESEDDIEVMEATVHTIEEGEDNDADKKAAALRVCTTSLYCSLFVCRGVGGY